MSTLKATNIKNESSASNNIVLDSGGGAIFSGVTTFSSSVNFNSIGSLTLGTGTTIGAATSNTFTILTNGSERVRVDSLGDVGIGTTNPIGQLQVSSGPVIIGAATSTGTASQTLQVTGGGYVSGNLGVGTTNPISQLQVSSGPVIIGSATSTGTTSQNLQVTGGAYVSGNLGIGTTNPGFKLEVNGSFAATTKSFLIPHPTKENYKLRHGSLEGPENGVYVRGRTSAKIIELPDYWIGLVDEDSITVNLTPIGNINIWVEEINNNKVYINSEDTIDCFYTIFSERKDIEKLIVEIEEN